MIGDGAKDAFKRKVAKEFLEGDGAQAILRIITTVEERLLTAVDEQHDVLDLDQDIDVPESEERAERLRELWLAKMEDRVPEWWVEYRSGIEHAGEAAQFAGLDEDAWRQQLGTWADRYRRDQDLEGGDRELAAGHVEARYGVGLEAFEELVVGWDDDRESDALRAAVVGPIDEAIGGIERATDHLRESGE